MNNKIKLPGFVAFISSPAGRLLRVVAGVALIAYGWMQWTTVGYVIALVGLVPLLAGAFDVCILGGFLGGPYKGDAMRQALHAQENHPELGTRPASFVRA